MRTFYFLFTVILISPIAGQTLKSPGPRDHLGLTYDENRNKVVLFGGNDVDENGKYIWNPSTWEWQNEWQEVDIDTPGTISSMGMIYNPSSTVSVMVGGINPAIGDLDDTWIWNGDKWIELKGSTPGIRLSPAMAYDEKREEVVLFSGCTGSEYPTDTWIFKNSKWKKVAEDGPNGVCRAAMFYDQTREQVILFGGALSRSGKTNKMWGWDGEKWNEIDQGTTIPSVRANILIAYDEHRKRAVLYGGSGSEGVLEDLWEWDGNVWSRVAKQQSWPGPREVYGIVYHKKLNRILLYGGRTGFAKPKGDFWSWDGETWEQID